LVINSGLFQQEPDDDLEGRIARGEVEVIKADPDDPFGDDVIELHPEYNPQHKPKPQDDPDYVAIKKAESNFRKRTRELFEAEGWNVYEVDRRTHFWAQGQQQTVTSDLYGLFDQEAWKGKDTIGIQFTSRGHLGSHLTKACAHVAASGKDATWRATWLRRWLEAGRRAVLVGWWKDGARWRAEVREVTLYVLESHEPRTRGKKT
jgi:hypothetical protein